MYVTPTQEAKQKKKQRKRQAKQGWYVAGQKEISIALEEKNAKTGGASSSILCRVGMHRYRRHHTFGYPAWWSAHQSINTGVYICTHPGCNAGFIKDITVYCASC